MGKHENIYPNLCVIQFRETWKSLAVSNLRRRSHVQTRKYSRRGGVAKISITTSILSWMFIYIHHLENHINEKTGIREEWHLLKKIRITLRHSGKFLAGIYRLNEWIPAKNLPGWRNKVYNSL